MTLAPAIDYRAPDSIVRHGPFTAAEIKAFIRKHAKGRRLFVRAGVHLPIPDSNEAFETSCLVRTSRKFALEYVDDSLSGSLENRGARMRVSMSARCMFIG